VISRYISTSPKRKLRNNIDVTDYLAGDIKERYSKGYRRHIDIADILGSQNNKTRWIMIGIDCTYSHESEHHSGNVICALRKICSVALDEDGNVYIIVGQLLQQLWTDMVYYRGHVVFCAASLLHGKTAAGLQKLRPIALSVTLQGFSVP